MRVLLRWVSFCAATALAAAASGWPDPFPFEISTMGIRFAVAASVKGRATSDGKTVEITVERCELYRPKSFGQPQEVTKITAGIVRKGEKGESRFVVFGNSQAVNRVLNPDQTIALEPFQLRIPVADYPLAKGDYLAFNIEIPITNEDKRTTAALPLYPKDPLPVTDVTAYCADTVEQFKRPGQPFLQAYHVCYDSAGRSRKERWSYPSADAPKSAGTVVSVEIMDPVANLIYTLDPRVKKAWRRKGFTSPAGFGVALGGIIGSVPGGALSPVQSDRALGTSQINGIEADGKVHTTVYPVGYQGRPEGVTTTEETWYSYRIQAHVRRLRNDPRNGDYEYQVKNIEPAEPDAKLFRIPDDYEVVELK